MTTTLDKSKVEAAVLNVLRGIRTKQGFPNESLSGSSVALKLSKFDSQMGLVATIKIARALGISIPAKTNIFVSADGRTPLSINQSVERIMQSANAA